MSKRLVSLLAVGIAVAVLTLWLTYAFSGVEKRDGYDAALDAYERMRRCMECIKAEKQQRGIAIPPEDTFQTGLIGEEFNFITTTLGDISAKRTTADPDMAAMTVFLLKEAGLKEGDTLGCSFSGSFPGMNIAVLCACDSLGITPVYICSCGASTWGANNPELCFPEMAAVLYEAGLISAPPALITPGGGDDTGSGVDSDMFSDIWQRVCSLGYPTSVNAVFSENIAEKRALFREHGIDCFLTAGGNITALGYNMVTDYLGQGILQTEITRVNEKSGLLELYLHDGVPSVLLLNIRQLAADRGFDFDPTVQKAPGTADFYYQADRPLYILRLGLAAEAALGVLYAKRRKADEREQELCI